MHEHPLTNRVKQALVAEHLVLDSLKVDRTADETIYLSGCVPTTHLRHAAILIARQVDGVRYVGEGIQVVGE